MTNMRILTLAAILWIPAATRADEKAATPEELVELWQAASKTGDLKAQLPFLGGPHRKLNEQAIDMLAAANAFDKALDDKFGKDPDCRSCFALQSKPVKRVEMKGKKDLGGGKVELTIWTVRDAVFETREVAIRENGGWVLLAPAPFTYSTAMEEIRMVDGKEVKVRVESQPQELTPDQLAAARVALPRTRTVFERGAKDVAAGKLASRKAAVTAIDNEVIATFDQAQGKSAGKIDRGSLRFPSEILSQADFPSADAGDKKFNSRLVVPTLQNSKPVGQQIEGLL